MKIPHKLFVILLWILVCATTPGLLSSQQDEIGNALKNEDIYVASLTELTYPVAARVSHKEGVVVVRVRFDDEGRVVSSEAISGPKDLIVVAITNAKKWRFHLNATRTAVLVYEFKIDGFCSGGSHFVFREPNVASITGCSLGGSSTPGISPN